jgi:uncharacterized protein with HEPN domain
MSDKTLRTGDYLGHILQAIARIQRYTSGLTEATFCADEMVQDAVIRNIEIIGEAARNVERNDPAFAQQHSGVPWAVMYGMRNRLSHGYHQIDLQLVWNTVQSDLPVLAQMINALLPADDHA